MSGRPILAADARPWLLADDLWERLVAAGLAAFDAGRLDDAGALWISALAHAERFAGDDPRRATALNNIAAVRHLRGGADEADGFYRAALDAWAAAEPWIDAMAIAPRARSSLFHMRLEEKHRADYHRIARAELRKLLDEGRAASLGNLAALCRSAGRAADADALEAEATDRAPRGVKPGLERWAVLAPPRHCDERRLAAAAFLLAHPAAIPDDAAQ